MSGNSISVKIAGGLGNQLFQYATARSVALRTSAPLELDLSFYRSRRHRRFQLDAFPISVQRMSGRGTAGRLLEKWLHRGEVYQEPHYHFDSTVLSLQAPVKLKGYFQTPRYFDEFADIIRAELKCPDPINPEVQRYGQRIASQASASLHVRRGDYVTDPNAKQTFASCSVDYYARALERFSPDVTVYVFSDDLDWCREHLPDSEQLCYPPDDLNPSDLDDFWLMTQARHHVIANSSFSWWAAWLATQEDAINIAPEKWFVDPSRCDDDLIPDDWIRV